MERKSVKKVKEKRKSSTHKPKEKTEHRRAPTEERHEKPRPGREVRAARLHDLQATNEVQKEEIARLRTELEGQAAMSTDRDQEIAELRAELDAKTAAVGSYADEVSALRIAVAEKEGLIEAERQRPTGEERVADLEQVLGDRDQEIADLRAELDAKTAAVGSYANQSADRDQEIAELRAELDAKTAAVGSYADEVSALRIAVAEKEGLIEAERQRPTGEERVADLEQVLGDRDQETPLEVSSPEAIELSPIPTSVAPVAPARALPPRPPATPATDTGPVISYAGQYSAQKPAPHVVQPSTSSPIPTRSSPGYSKRMLLDDLPATRPQPRNHAVDDAELTMNRMKEDLDAALDAVVDGRSALDETYDPMDTRPDTVPLPDRDTAPGEAPVSYLAMYAAQRTQSADLPDVQPEPEPSPERPAAPRHRRAASAGMGARSSSAGRIDGYNNSKIVINALGRVLAGPAEKDKVVAVDALRQAMKAGSSQFVMVLASPKAHLYRALYVVTASGQLSKLHGVGAETLDLGRITTYFKYDCGGKEFRPIAVSELSCTVAAVALMPRRRSAKPVL